MRNYP